MTAQRRRWKPRRRLAVVFAALAGLGILLPNLPLHAVTTERVVADARSGLAIDGFDPVAYFTDADARLGSGDFELIHAGVVWRFRNEGNRAAFAADPDIYMPRFGGYDPMSVGRGTSAPGHGELFRVTEHRLYLFFSPASREAFLRDPERAIEAAEREWPAVRRRMVP